MERKGTEGETNLGRRESLHKSWHKKGERREKIIRKLLLSEFSFCLFAKGETREKHMGEEEKWHEK